MNKEGIMFNVIEQKGVPHVFNLNNGKSLRIYAYQTIPLSNALAESPEIVSAEKLGLISLVEVTEEKPVKSTETKKTKGGKK